MREACAKAIENRHVYMAGTHSATVRATPLTATPLADEIAALRARVAELEAQVAELEADTAVHARDLLRMAGERNVAMAERGEHEEGT